MSTSSLPIFFISILHLSIYESILATAWARWVLRAVLSCRRGNHRTFQHSPRIWSLQVGFLFIFFTPVLYPLPDTNSWLKIFKNAQKRLNKIWISNLIYTHDILVRLLIVSSGPERYNQCYWTIRLEHYPGDNTDTH